VKNQANLTLLPSISYPVSGAFKTPFHPRDCTNIFAPFISSMHPLTKLKTAQFSLQILDNHRFTH
jgi:hypothetical protein